MSKTISFRFKKGNAEDAKFANMFLEIEREKAGYTKPKVDQLLTDYDEWAAERQEIAEHTNAAQLSGEITPEQADEARRMIATEEAE